MDLLHERKIAYDIKTMLELQQKIDNYICKICDEIGHNHRECAKRCNDLECKDSKTHETNYTNFHKIGGCLVCEKCGKKGHVRANCPAELESICCYCRQKGHSCEICPNICSVYCRGTDNKFKPEKGTDADYRHLTRFCSLRFSIASVLLEPQKCVWCKTESRLQIHDMEKPIGIKRYPVLCPDCLNKLVEDGFEIVY